MGRILLNELPSHHLASACSERRPVLVGSESGGLHELVLEERERKEKVWRLLTDLPAALPGPAAGTSNSPATASPVRGLHQQALPGGGLLVLVSTPARLYVLGSQQPAAEGSSSLEALFAAPLGDPREPSPHVMTHLLDSRMLHEVTARRLCLLCPRAIYVHHLHVSMSLHDSCMKSRPDGPVLHAPGRSM